MGEATQLVLVDIYVPKDTMLHRLDPRVKIIGALLLTILCFFLTSIIFLAALLIFLQILIVTTGIKWKSYRSSVWLVARFSIILVLLWPFFDKMGDPVLLDLWAYKVTLPALLRSSTVALRLFVIASGWLVLLISTRQGNLVRGLVKLGCPYDFGISLSIGLRYIPNFIGVIEMIKEAQLSRGLDLKKGGPITRAKNLIPVLIPTFVIAIRTIDGLSSALVSRGYGASVERTFYRDIRMRISDAVVVGILTTVVPLLIILDIANMVAI